MKEHSVRKKVRKGSFEARIRIPNFGDGDGIHVLLLSSKEDRYSCLITRLNEDFQSTPKREDILSVIELDESEIGYAPHVIGQVIQTSIANNKNKDNFYSHELMQHMKKAFSSSFNCEMEITNNVKRSPVEQAQFKKVQEQQFKEQKANRAAAAQNTPQEIMDLKPLILLEEMEKLGFINILKREANGQEVKVKLKLSDDATYGDVTFNLSVANHGTLSNSNSNFKMKDFTPGRSKMNGIESGSTGVIGHMMINGFGDTKNMSPAEINSSAKNFLMENIIPFVDKDRFIRSEMGEVSLHFPVKAHDHIATKNYEYSKKTMHEFLNFRGIQNDTIEKLTKENVLATGDIHFGKFIKEYEKNPDGSVKRVKGSYSLNKKAFFRLREGEEGRFDGAEAFNIRKLNNGGGKPFDYSKSNVGGVTGKYWRFGAEKSPDMAIIQEAIIDGLSNYEMFKDMPHVDENNVAYYSIQGTSHLSNFFRKNLNFDIKWINGEKKLINIYNNINHYPLKETDIQKYQKTFSEKNITFLNYDSIDNTSNFEKIKVIQETLGLKIDVKNYKNAESVPLEQFKGDDDMIFDNMDDYLKAIGVDFKDNVLHKYVEKTSEGKQEMTDKNKKFIGYKIKKFFGTDHLVFALDNDIAGLEYVKHFTEIERQFGIKTSFLIPDDYVTNDVPVKSNLFKSFKGVTIKDTMQKYQALCKENKYDDAYALIDKYMEQAPEVDCNDVLKKYQELKSSNPKLAKELLDRKIDQLDFTPKSARQVVKKKRNNKPN